MKKTCLLTFGLFVLILCLILCDENQPELASILFFILVFLSKNIYEEYAYKSTIDEFYPYYSDYEDYTSYTPNSKFHQTHSYNYSSYPRYVPKTDEILKEVFHKMKPNLHVVFETDEKTQTINAKKQSSIEKQNEVVIETKTEQKQQLLLPPPPQQTIQTVEQGFNDIVYITNTSDLSETQKKLYETIIHFLQHKQASVAITKCMLNNIIYADIVKETKTIVLYAKELNLMSKYCINDNDMIDYVKQEFNNWSISIIKFMPISPLDFYNKNYC